MKGQLENFLSNWDPNTIEQKALSEVEKINWIKIVVNGDLGTGKTSLIKNFCEGSFTQAYTPTVGVDYGFKIEVISDVSLRVHLWDFSGDANYSDIRKNLYSDADALLIVFDLSSRKSFKNLDMWLDESRKHLKTARCKTIVIGNKSDLKDKSPCVPQSDTKEWVASKKVKYCETSVISGAGVNSAFRDLLKDIVKERNIKPNVKS